MDSLLKDLRYAVRSLLKHPSFTLLAVITLGLGIGANTAIFSVLYAVLLQPLPYGEAERIVRVEETEGRGGMGVSPPNFIDFQEQNHSFERMAAYSGGSLILTGNGEPARLESATVSRDLFSVLKANPLLGRSFNATDENENQGRAAILSYGLWQARFAADHAIVGRQITLDGKAYSIVGVMSRDFEFPIQTNRVELWTPLTFTEDLSNLRGAHYLDVVGRVKPGVNPSEANADLELIAGRIAQQFPKLVSGRTTVVPIKNDLVGDVRPYLLMLSVAVAFVLLIAAANVASLMLARAAERQKEVALRLALGASRLRVLRQLLAESLLLSVIGGVAGILLALWGTELMIGIGPTEVPRIRSAGLNLPVLLFAIAASIFTGILCGLFPAWCSSKPDLQTQLKEGENRTASTPKQTARKVLVVAEITLALMLLCGAGLLIRTMWKLNSVPPGFDPDSVMVAEIVLPRTKYRDDAKQRAFFQELLSRLKSLPGVESVGDTTNLPLSGTNMVFLASVAGSSSPPAPASFRAVGGDYFGALRIPVMRGRAFTDADTASSPAVAVISETMARQIAPAGDAIGKRINHGFKNQVAEVVGVVGDVKYAGLDQQAKPEMYVPFTQRPWPFLRVVLRGKTAPTGLAAGVRSVVQTIDPDQPVDKVITMRSILASSVAARRFYMQLLASFALLAFVLAAVGIYGVVSYSVAQRTHEFGIRIALGAKQGDVSRLVLAEGIKLLCFGSVLGFLGAFAATRVLRKLLFQVTATDPLTFMTLGVLLGVVALIAGYIPARRATKIDPLLALRHE